MPVAPPLPGQIAPFTGQIATNRGYKLNYIDSEAGRQYYAPSQIFNAAYGKYVLPSDVWASGTPFSYQGTKQITDVSESAQYPTTRWEPTEITSGRLFNENPLASDPFVNVPGTGGSFWKEIAPLAAFAALPLGAAFLGPAIAGAGAAGAGAGGGAAFGAGVAGAGEAGGLASLGAGIEGIGAGTSFGVGGAGFGAGLGAASGLVQGSGGDLIGESSFGQPSWYGLGGSAADEFGGGGGGSGFGGLSFAGEGGGGLLQALALGEPGGGGGGSGPAGVFGGAGGLSKALDVGTGLYGLYQALMLQNQAKKVRPPTIIDPFGMGQRGAYASQLQQLMANPALLQQMPGYEAGLQAVTRNMAAQGYLGSGNMMAALSNYGGDAFSRETARLAGLSGANLSPIAVPYDNSGLAAQATAAQLAGSSLNRLSYLLRGSNGVK